MVQPGTPGWATDLRHLEALAEVSIAIDPKGRIVYANEAASHRYPALRDGELPLDVIDLVLPRESIDGFHEVLAQVLRGEVWAGPLTVLSASGGFRSVELRCSPIVRDDVVLGALCVISPEPGHHGDAARHLDRRLTRLARVAAELGSAEDLPTVTEVVTRHAADAVGATVASLAVLEGDTLVLAGLRGGRSGAAQRWQRFSVHEPTPAGEVVRTGQPVLMIGRAEIAARYPQLERAAEGERSLACLPIRAGGRMVGVFTLSFPGRRELDDAELNFFDILGDSCAQALGRIQAQQLARDRLARLRFLADVTTELSSSLDYQATLTNVARMVVPVFADWSAIDVVEDERLHRLAVEHVDPRKVQLALDIEQRYPADKEAAGGAWAVVRSGQSVLIPEITDQMLVEAAKDAEHLALARSLGLKSLMLVPLMARGRQLGVMTWATAESARGYTDSHIAFAEDLARRAAVAIDNAQLHSQVRDAALQLQHAVLPELSASIPGWELTSTYHPAGRTEVGGDFYDAWLLPDGRLAGFIGDVMGRGVSAAAAMAQMRSALRAFIAVDPAPEQVMEKLDQFVDAYGVDQLVTVAYFLADPEADELTVLNAGHLPPMIIRSDGSTEVLPEPQSPPLGVALASRRPDRVRFAAGDAVIGYTDGLVERRGEDLDVGLARLRQALVGVAGPAAATTLDELANRLRDPSRDDDVAALLVRRLGS